MIVIALGYMIRLVWDMERYKSERKDALAAEVSIHRQSRTVYPTIPSVSWNTDPSSQPIGETRVASPTQVQFTIRLHDLVTKLDDFHPSSEWTIAQYVDFIDKIRDEVHVVSELCSR